MLLPAEADAARDKAVKPASLERSGLNQIVRTSEPATKLEQFPCLLDITPPLLVPSILFPYFDLRQSSLGPGHRGAGGGGEAAQLSPFKPALHLSPSDIFVLSGVFSGKIYYCLVRLLSEEKIQTIIIS